VTDSLIEMSRLAAAGDDYYGEAFQNFADRHQSAIEELLPEGALRKETAAQMRKSHDVLKNLLYGNFLLLRLNKDGACLFLPNTWHARNGAARRSATWWRWTFVTSCCVKNTFASRLAMRDDSPRPRRLASPLVYQRTAKAKHPCLQSAGGLIPCRRCHRV
jgi:hypothetical protein